MSWGIGKMLSSEEFECGCCYDLLLDPTTLTCGHSFCRYCLAKWFKESKKTECPECRQTWTGFPKVNIHLRSIIEKSFPEQIKVRMRSQQKTSDYHNILKQFEENGKKEGGQTGSLSEEQIKMFIGTVVLVFAAVLIVLFIGIFYWMLFAEARPTEVIYSKTVDRWSVKEVVSWAQVFSGKLGHDYSERFAQAGIDGKVLMSLEEDDLESAPLSISTPLHRKIILAEILKLNMAGVKQPSDLWEYKNAHRISSIFLLFMLQDFPRLTMLYYRFVDYDMTFLPFIQTVIDKPQHCEENEDDFYEANNNDRSECSQEEITSMDKAWFYTKLVFLPYYLIARFSCYFVDIHFFTVWIIISHCLMLTVRETLQLRKVQISLRTLWKTIFEATISFFTTWAIYRIAVWFIPAFILDFCFFAKLYYGPLDTANSIRNGHLQTNAIGKVLDVVFGAINKVVRLIAFLINTLRGR